MTAVASGTRECVRVQQLCSPPGLIPCDGLGERVDVVHCAWMRAGSYRAERWRLV